MANKKPNTPRSKVKAALRNLWMRSRERAAALKKTDYKCTECGVKQSTAKGREVKMEVHHLSGIEWENLIDLVYEMLLNAPQVPLCKSCHKIETDLARITRQENESEKKK